MRNLSFAVEGKGGDVTGLRLWSSYQFWVEYVFAPPGLRKQEATICSPTFPRDEKWDAISCQTSKGCDWLILGFVWLHPYASCKCFWCGQGCFQSRKGYVLIIDRSLKDFHRERHISRDLYYCPERQESCPFWPLHLPCTNIFLLSLLVFYVFSSRNNQETIPKKKILRPDSRQALNSYSLTLLCRILCGFWNLTHQWRAILTTMTSRVLIYLSRHVSVSVTFKSRFNLNISLSMPTFRPRPRSRHPIPRGRRLNAFQ